MGVPQVTQHCCEHMESGGRAPYLKRILRFPLCLMLEWGTHPEPLVPGGLQVSILPVS